LSDIEPGGLAQKPNPKFWSTHCSFMPSVITTAKAEGTAWLRSTRRCPIWNQRRLEQSAKDSLSRAIGLIKKVHATLLIASIVLLVQGLNWSN
jgi:hypothetical protein